MGIGETIKTTRIARGWSQQQLADAVGVKRQDIQRIEAGKVSPSFAKAGRILAALGIDIKLHPVTDL